MPTHVQLALEPYKVAFRKTGHVDGLLEERFNPDTGQNEFKTQQEWERILELTGPAPTAPNTTDYDREFPPLPGVAPAVPTPTTGVSRMNAVDKGVHVANSGWEAAAQARLRIERGATSALRAGMTSHQNKRTGVAKQGVENACEMAGGLAEILVSQPQLVQKGGLLVRIMGGVAGQGQHAKNEDETEQQTASRIAARIQAAAGRLALGGGEDDDGNMILQFIGCFADGLTEVIEGKSPAVEQFDTLWPLIQRTFGLQANDKQKLLDRVDGYKQIAGAASDTLSGKVKRRGHTRKGEMPNDPRLKISDSNALIKGDISGSMHSSLLAQELATTLFAGNPIKPRGASVLVTDKRLLDARAMDAIALTAGGMEGVQDTVYHTAFEMLNGMRAISGAPEVSQAMATEIMDRMSKGASYTDAFEESFDDDDLPWLP